MVAINNGKIIYAGKSKQWQAMPDEDVISLDFSGKSAFARLDRFRMSTSRGGGEADSQFKMDDGAMTLKILQNARKNLAAGITTVRDLGGWNELGICRATFGVRHHDFSAARMMLAGRFISISESGADYYEGMYRIADGVEAVRKATREQIRNGADLIKLGVTGAVLVEDGVPGATHFNADEIRVAVEEAEKFGKGVARARARHRRHPQSRASRGSSIEHGTFLYQGPDVVEEMKQRGTFLVPTLKPGWDVVNGDRSKIPQWIVDKMIETQDAAIQSLRLAYQAGVPIVMEVMPVRRSIFTVRTVWRFIGCNRRA